MKNKNLLSAGFTIALGVASLAGCATSSSKVTAVKSNPAAEPAAAAAPAAAVEQPVLSGKVVETMNAGGYTYVSLEKNGKKTWSAIPESQVAVGDEIVLIPGIDMANFSSTSLKRVFPSIHFSAGIQSPKGAPEAKAAAKSEEQALPPNHPALPKQDAAAAKAPAKEAAPAAAPAPVSGKVVEAMDAGGYTYICLEKDGAKTWAAIPATEVKVGSEMKIAAGQTMPSFTSKSLKRTFENIIFSPGAVN